MKRRNRGQVLVLVALAIFVLLGLAALGIDVGFMYSVRHELQRSADAGALAGASAFTTGNWNDTSMSSTSPRGIADFRARDFASKDKVVQTTLNQASEVAVSFPRADHIEVVTSRIVDLFFARIFGMSNQLITARAVARAEVTDLGTNCIKPFAIPYPWTDNLAAVKHGKTVTIEPGSDGLYNTGEHVQKTCNPPQDNLCQGTLMTIKIGNPGSPPPAPSGQQTSGQFFLIQGNEGTSSWFTGGADERAYIREGCFVVDPSKPLNLLTGDKMGPTRQGIEDLINNDNTHATWLPAAGGEPGKPSNFSSSRVIRIAMYDPSIPMQDGAGPSGGSGTQTSIQPGYVIAGFWVVGVASPSDGGSVTGYYISAQAFGSSSGTTPVNPTGTEVKKVALVE